MNRKPEVEFGLAVGAVLPGNQHNSPRAKERDFSRRLQVLFSLFLSLPIPSLPHTSTYILGSREKGPLAGSLSNKNVLLKYSFTVFSSGPYMFVYLLNCDRNVWNSALKVNLFFRSRLEGIWYRGQPHCAVWHYGTMAVHSHRLFWGRLMTLKKQNSKNVFHW